MDYEEIALREFTYMMWEHRSHMTRSLERGVHGEMFVLRELMKSGPRTPSQLAAAMNVTSGRISTVLTALAKKGLITRTNDPHDRRSVVIDLSEQGREQVSHHNKRLHASLRWVFAQMGEQHTRQFIDLVSDFITYVSLLQPDEQSYPTVEQVHEAFEKRAEERAQLHASLAASDELNAQQSWFDDLQHDMPPSHAPVTTAEQ